MEVKLLSIKGTWREVADSCNTTIGKDPGEKDPSSSWKRRLLLSEHSPIRQIIVKFKWTDLPYWVSVHIVRHWLGIIHWVTTQRSDRTGISRNELPQGALVAHEVEVNAQALINISRKRLCYQASPETRRAWELAIASFQRTEPELYSACVRDCVYRGWCFEYKSCGYHRSENYLDELAMYRYKINS
jgi:hypothetical protein